MNEILQIVEVQLEAQSQTEDSKYDEWARSRDALVAGLTPRQRVHAKLAFGILDRLLNPVRMQA